MFDYEEMLGKVTTPEQHVNWCIHQGRRTGKTQKLIYSIPKDQDVIVLVHNIIWRKELKKTIQRERPELDIKRIHFVSYTDPMKQFKFNALRASCDAPPIFVDNAVLDVIQLEFVRKLNETTL